MMVDNMVNQTLNDSDCISMDIVKPDDVTPCNNGPCPRFRDRGFGPVSSDGVAGAGGYRRGGEGRRGTCKVHNTVDPR